MGIGSYVTAPLWLLFLVTGILISLQARFVPPDYFPAGRRCSRYGRRWIRSGRNGCSSAPWRCCWVRSCWPMRR